MAEPKQIYFSLFKTINASRSVSGLIKKSGVRILFPFYHVVSNNALPHIKHLYDYKTESQFKEDINFLLKYYTPLHIDDFLNNNYNPEKNYFILSFDDGLREIYDIVFPILKQYNIPAIFFINSDFADNKGLFFRYKISIIIDKLLQTGIPKSVSDIFMDKPVNQKNIKTHLKNLTYQDSALIDSIASACQINFDEFLEKEKPYMSSAQISELQNAGHTIGAHSANHPLYSAISADEQIAQTAASMQFVDEKFPAQNRYFAFPFTADGVSENVLKTMFAELKIDLAFGTAGMKKMHGNLVERIPMEKNNDNAKQIIKNEYAWFLFKQLMRRK